MNAATMAGMHGLPGGRTTRPLWVHGLPAILLTWLQRARQRQQLAHLEEWQLRDIGICRAVADLEARKPFWEA